MITITRILRRQWLTASTTSDESRSPRTLSRSTRAAPRGDTGVFGRDVNDLTGCRRGHRVGDAPAPEHEFASGSGDRVLPASRSG